MNQPIPEGANLAELAKVAVAAKDLTREALDAAVAASADDGFTADEYLAQTAVSDTSELEPLVDAVLAANPGQVEQYKGGKEGLLGFFVGQVMKETGGKANPKVVSDLLQREAEGVIDEANEILRAKGYSAAHLNASAAPLPGKVLLKGTKILSPFSDTAETVLRVVREAVPTADELGRRQLTPHELRDRLES